MNTALSNKPNIQIYGKINNPVIFKWTRIIIFESLASLIYTYGLMSTYYYSNTTIINTGHSAFLSLNLFMCLVFAGQLTGGHTTPIVTFCLLIGRGNYRINIVNFFIYIFSEYAGSFLGGALAYGVIPQFSVQHSQNRFSIAQIFGGQIMGSFLLCLWLLIVVNDKTTFIKSNFWNYMLFPVIFYIAREVTSQISGLNPAAVLANQVFYGIRYDNWEPLESYWAYIVGSMIGSTLAALFFNFFYYPLLMRWKSRK